MKLLVALTTLALEKYHGTKATAIAMAQLLKYFAMHLDAIIRYKQSKKNISIHSDVSYLSEPKALSRECGHFFLTNKPKRGQPMVNNGSVHVISTIIRNVMSSASKAKIVTLYLNAKDGVDINNTLE